MDKSQIDKSLVNKEINDIWHELGRLQKQRDEDILNIQDITNQSQFKDNEYK